LERSVFIRSDTSFDQAYSQGVKVRWGCLKPAESMLLPAQLGNYTGRYTLRLFLPLCKRFWCISTCACTCSCACSAWTGGLELWSRHMRWS